VVSFLGRSRLFGEEAIPQMFGDNTVTSLNLLLGKDLATIQKSALFAHRKPKFSEQSGCVLASVAYCGEEALFSVDALMGMFVAQLVERLVTVHGHNYKLAFAVPSTSSSAVLQSIRDACEIAHVESSRVHLYAASDALVATYGRKLSGLRPPEKATLEGKNVMLIDVGHTSSSAVVVRAYEPVKGGNDGNGPIKLGEASSDVVGGLFFDLKMFDHLSGICESKHQTKVATLCVFIKCNRLYSLIIF
jgi:molecular chaperone DnaK (HSP70)